MSTVLAILLLALPFLVACNGGDDSDDTSDPVPNLPSETSSDAVVITIGNHNDMTGVGSTAIKVMTKALEDMAAYYSDQKLIPGVKFEVVTFDGSYDPSLDITGYEQLKAQGADLIYTAVSPTSVNLKPLVDMDKMVLFVVAPAAEAFKPPGWVIAPGQALIQHGAATLLKWIAENDPDFPKDRPAKIGGAFWNEAYGQDCLAGAEEYAKAHPDQYEWVGGFLSEWNFIWADEVEALKDCDYVFPAIPPTQFIRQYRDGGGKATFIGSDAHIAFLPQLRNAGLWDEVDGMWLVKPSQWWNDEGPIVDLTKKMLQIYRSDEANEIIQEGVPYLSSQQVYVMFELIRAAAETVGPENLDSQAIYDAAKSFSITVDGCPHSLTETKRTSSDAMAIYELRSAEGDIFRADNAWLPIVYGP